MLALLLEGMALTVELHRDRRRLARVYVLVLLGSVAEAFAFQLLYRLIVAVRRRFARLDGRVARTRTCGLGAVHDAFQNFACDGRTDDADAGGRRRGTPSGGGSPPRESPGHRQRPDPCRDEPGT
ncbi:MAG: hypothetical protein U0V56_05305 [Actinomycetota bacterium]